MSYNPDLPAVSLAFMFGYIVNAEGSIQVANRIFETRLYNLFLAEEELMKTKRTKCNVYHSYRLS